MNKNNKWWLKKHNVLGKTVKLIDNKLGYCGKGYWCSYCYELNRVYNPLSKKQKCKHCKRTNLVVDNE